MSPRRSLNTELEKGKLWIGLTWPDAAWASARSETDSHTCKHIWWAAIGSAPWRAAIDVLKVMVMTAAKVLPRRKPPEKIVYPLEYLFFLKKKNKFFKVC